MAWLSYGWWIACMAAAAILGGYLDHWWHTHHQPPQQERPHKVRIYNPCGCGRWIVIGHRVPFRAPCPAHMVLDEMHRIVDAEQKRLQPGRRHWS
jgi:hypothetical protein